MKGKEKKQKNKLARAPRISPGPVPAIGSWRRRLALVLVLLVVGGGTWAVFEFVVWNNVPSELVGKWVVTRGPDEGGTIDFYRNGAMVAKVNQDGFVGIINAKIRVADKKIHVTTTHQNTGEQGTRVQTIKSLEGNFLVLEDERGVSISLDRAE